MVRTMGLVAGLAMALVGAAPAAAQENGLRTVPSAHSVPDTIARFGAGVRGAGWVVFTEIDHAQAARAVGLDLRPRTVVIFGNPRAGTPAMQGNPTLALDLPLRILVWQDDQGRTQVTRSTGEDIATRIFARHGIAQPPPARQATDEMLERLVRQAAE